MMSELGKANDSGIWVGQQRGQRTLGRANYPPLWTDKALEIKAIIKASNRGIVLYRKKGIEVEKARLATRLMWQAWVTTERSGFVRSNYCTSVTALSWSSSHFHSSCLVLRSLTIRVGKSPSGPILHECSDNVVWGSYQLLVGGVDTPDPQQMYKLPRLLMACEHLS